MEGGRLRRTPVSGERAGTLAGRFHAARHDPGLVVLEGLHALKHAQRFGADLLQIVMSDDATADALASDLAPDTLPLRRPRCAYPLPSSRSSRRSHILRV